MANGAQELRDYMRDYFLPSYSPTKEAFINHSVWKYFKNRDYIVATECVLPGAVKFERRQVKIKGFEPGTRPPNLKAAIRYAQSQVQPTSTTIRTGHYKIDITAVPKSNLNKKEPSKLEIVGAECKASLKAVDKLTTKLNSYLNSGELFCLYLAIPHTLESKVRKIFADQRLHGNEDFTNIGILSVNANGEVIEIKEPKELEMKPPYPIEIEKRDVKGGKFEERLYIRRGRYA